MFLDTIWLAIDQKIFVQKINFAPSSCFSLQTTKKISAKKINFAPLQTTKKISAKKINFSPSSCFSLMDADEPRKKFLFKKNKK
jgi:hypothetical protein